VLSKGINGGTTTANIASNNGIKPVTGNAAGWFCVGSAMILPSANTVSKAKQSSWGETSFQARRKALRQKAV
jgi:hypothetical protein